jgi:hypothetical protein
MVVNFCHGYEGGTMNHDDYIHGCHRGKIYMAAGTINDIIHYFQEALWMMSSMVATKRREHQVTLHTAVCTGIYLVIFS